MNNALIEKYPKRNESTCQRLLPPWFKQKIPNKESIKKLKKILNEANLHTVCQSAHCPNLGQCWEKGVATFMILGDVCTRSCKFCAVKTGQPLDVDPQEPRMIALVVKELKLNYVVVTSVTRDDLLDKGVDQFVKVIKEVQNMNPSTKIEVLVPDFDNQMNLLKKLVESKPDVIGHNIEMVKQYYHHLRPQANYQRSLSVLRNLKTLDPSIIVKSGFMLGLGESKDEVMELLEDLKSSGCESLTIGQYLAPSSTSLHVQEKCFIAPEEFEEYRMIALKMGFRDVFSGPLVRSSYLAEENFKQLLN